MPSAIGHVAPALALIPLFDRRDTPRRLWVLGVLCAVAPDLDVLAFRFGIPYEHALGHRGFTHSIPFAAALAAPVSFSRSRGHGPASFGLAPGATCSWRRPPTACSMPHERRPGRRALQPVRRPPLLLSVPPDRSLAAGTPGVPFRARPGGSRQRARMGVAALRDTGGAADRLEAVAALLRRPFRPRIGQRDSRITQRAREESHGSPSRSSVAACAGEVRYSLDEDPVTLYVCHCTDCQTQSGASFGLSLIVRHAAFRFVRGKPGEASIEMPDGRVKRFHFCSRCSTRFGGPSSVPGLAVIDPGTLDDTSWLRPVAHIWTRSVGRRGSPIPQGCAPLREREPQRRRLARRSCRAWKNRPKLE